MYLKLYLLFLTFTFFSLFPKISHSQFISNTHELTTEEESLIKRQRQLKAVRAARRSEERILTKREKRQRQLKAVQAARRSEERIFTQWEKSYVRVHIGGSSRWFWMKREKWEKIKRQNLLLRWLEGTLHFRCYEGS